MAQVTDDFAILVAFNEDAGIAWVQYPDGSKYDKPIGTFRDGIPFPVVWIEEFSMLIWEEDQNGNIIRKLCPHWKCDRYC
jgi:hypothetical protein